MSDPPRLPRQYNYPSIPEPTTDVQSLLNTVQRLKEVVELLTGQRGINEFSRSFSIQSALTEIRTAGSRVYELQEAGVGIARRVTGVETVADDVSASGQVVISAEANPTGYKAYFGVYLRANADTTPGTERRAGLHLGLDNSDGAVFALDVDKYILRDNASGDSTAVFTYGSGVFTMTGNVTINGSLMVTNTITGAKLVDLTTPTTKVAYNAIGQFYQNSGSLNTQSNTSFNTVCSVSTTGVTGGYAFINVRFRVLAYPDYVEKLEWRILRSDSTVVLSGTANVTPGSPGSGTYTSWVPTSACCFVSDAGTSWSYSFQSRLTAFTSPNTYNIDVTELSVEIRKR